MNLNFIYDHWGIIGVLLYVIIVVHGKSFWRWFKGTYVSYEDIDKRIVKSEGRLNQLETLVNSHSDRDKEQFQFLNDLLKTVSSEIKSHTESVMQELKESKREITEDIKLLTVRVDRLWERKDQAE